MKPPATLAEMVAAAIAAGRLRVFAEGERTLPVPLAPPRDVRMRPEGCGPGRMIGRHPSIDVYDRSGANR